MKVGGRNVLIVGGGASAAEALEYATDHDAASVKVLARVSPLAKDAYS